MKQLLKSGLLVILLSVTVLARVPAFAKPIISNVSKDFTHGSTLTIIGSGFGTHGDFHPDSDKLVRVWETFESGTFSGNGYKSWGLFNPPSLELIQNSSTSRGAVGDIWLYRRNNTNLGNIFTTGTDGSLRQEFWISHWLRKSDNFDVCQGGTTQWKGTRVTSNSNSSGRKVNTYSGYHCGAGSKHHIGIEFTVPQILRHQTYWYSNKALLRGSWHRWDMYIKRATSANSNDGKNQIYIDNVLAYDFKRDTGDLYYNGMDFDDQGGDFAREIAIGSYFSGASSDTYIDYDDIYISHTQARIEICNSSSFSSSNHCEIQTPTSWSNSTITVIANQGSLSPSEMYLYVVDRTGEVTDPGYPLYPGYPLFLRPPTGLTVK